MKLIHLFLFVFICGSAWAQTSSVPLKEDPSELFRKIWSPYCHGVSLMECPSSQAEDLRMQIRTDLAAGKSLKQITQELKEKYGDQLRMDPDGGGRESLAYIVPYIAITLAAIGTLIFWLLRRKKRSAVAPQNPRSEPPASAEFQAKIAKDLLRRS